jgi:DNA replication regulator DPB11
MQFEVAYRKELEDLINDNGGQYRGNLTREVTHLIAKVPSGPKYTYAGEWGIKIVSIEWLNQSIERGMILEESLFHLLLTASERGRNAWIRKTSPTSPLGKRVRDDAGPVLSRKLRRTASAKLNSQTNGLWKDIVGAGTESQGVKANEWDDEQTSNASLDVPKKPATERTPTAEPSVIKVGTQLLEQGDMERKILLGLTRRCQDAGIFQGKRFFVHGFKQKQVCGSMFIR